MQRLINLKLIWIALFSLVGCTNIMTHTGAPLSSMAPPTLISSVANYNQLPINVSVVTGVANSGSTPPLNLTVAFQSGTMYSSMGDFCIAGTGTAKPCSCQLEWIELNTVAGNSVSINRLRKLNATNIQTSLVQCQMTQDFWNQIPAGTVIKISVIPIAPNNSGLNSGTINYKKGTSVSSAGDFTDDTLTPFRNIYRYTCHNKRIATHEILNQFVSVPVNVPSGSATENAEVISASRFCPTFSTSANCVNPRGGYSAQSYYRNLYIRSDKVGQINSTNGGYDCPQVFESILDTANTANPTPQARQFKYWPLDTTFAVSTVQSSEWSVRITAGSLLNMTADPNSVDDAMPNADRLLELAAPNGISWKILGYGKVPKPDGTCGSIVDSSGRIRPLTRLRRYRVVYPPVFDDTGAPVQTRLEGDQIYVADRLVVDTNNNLTGNMIYGPKPCNFSWFDHEGVTNQNVDNFDRFKTNFSSIPNYKATSHYFNGSSAFLVNPDGKILPNSDRAGTMGSSTTPSCSSAIAVYDPDIGGGPPKARILTSYKNRTDSFTIGGRSFNLNQIHLSPMEPWNPEYVEDTRFEACVPLADPYVEPPMHFYRDNSGKMSWCSKVYPTQNPYWIELNSKKVFTGVNIKDKVVNWPSNNNVVAEMPDVQWFTSHKFDATKLDLLTNNGTTNSNGTSRVNACIGGTSAQKICEFSLGTSHSNYGSCITFLANKLSALSSVNRCDRTVRFDPNQSYRGFPLQANDSAIENMLMNDLTNRNTFSCNYSVHSNPNKVKNKEQPMSACCGVKNGEPILNSSGVWTGVGGSHMEPYKDPMFPDYRYCGTPVE